MQWQVQYPWMIDRPYIEKISGPQAVGTIAQAEVA
jgi:hypothetical protein